MMILHRFKDEFGPQSRDFIEQLAIEWLDLYGAPFIDKKRSFKRFSTVLDRLLLPKDDTVQLTADYDSEDDDVNESFSQSESEHPSDDEVCAQLDWHNHQRNDE